jgi:hypothetical protein
VDSDSETEVEDSIKSIRAMSYELCSGSDRDGSREQVLDLVFGRNIERLLKDSPQSGRRSRTDRAKLILRFVRDAERTLTLVELCHALDSSHREDDTETIMGADLVATNHCMGLIKVDQDQKVQFFHNKLREYLKAITFRSYRNATWNSGHHASNTSRRTPSPPDGAKTVDLWPTAKHRIPSSTTPQSTGPPISSVV